MKKKRKPNEGEKSLFFDVTRKVVITVIPKSGEGQDKLNCPFSCLLSDSPLVITGASFYCCGTFRMHVQRGRFERFEIEEIAVGVCFEANCFFFTLASLTTVVHLGEKFQCLWREGLLFRCLWDYLGLMLFSGINWFVERKMDLLFYISFFKTFSSCNKWYCAVKFQGIFYLYHFGRCDVIFRTLYLLNHRFCSDLRLEINFLVKNYEWIILENMKSDTSSENIPR